jgi:hypothetical protein
MRDFGSIAKAKKHIKQLMKKPRMNLRNTLESVNIRTIIATETAEIEG